MKNQTRTVSRRSLLRLTAAAAVLGLFWSCGGTEPEVGEEVPPEGVLDVCELVTSAEIEEVTGQAPGDPERSAARDACSWPAADGSGQLARIDLGSSVLDSYEDFVLSYQREFGGEEPERDRFPPVEGIGDWAMYFADEDILEVHSGDHRLRVSVAGDAREQEIALAERALSRLP